MLISDFTQSNNPTNTRKGGVSGYLKQSLTVRLVLYLNLKECLLLEVLIKKRLYGFIMHNIQPITYHSACHRKTLMIYNFEQLPSDIISWNPSFHLITGDYNVKTSSWWWRKDVTAQEGTLTEELSLDTGRKLNVLKKVQKTSRTSSERLMYVQVTSRVQRTTCFQSLNQLVLSPSHSSKIHIHPVCN